MRLKHLLSHRALESLRYPAEFIRQVIERMDEEAGTDVEPFCTSVYVVGWDSTMICREYRRRGPA